MKYYETIKEKKYKPLFGYGYEPRVKTNLRRETKQPELKYDAFGNVIYDLPVEADANVEALAQTATGSLTDNGTANAAETMPANGFEKPEGNPLMGVVIALTIVVALFLIAVIMSLKNEPETVRMPETVRYVICRMELSGTE